MIGETKTYHVHVFWIFGPLGILIYGFAYTKFLLYIYIYIWEICVYDISKRSPLVVFIVGQPRQPQEHGRITPEVLEKVGIELLLVSLENSSRHLSDISVGELGTFQLHCSMKDVGLQVSKKDAKGLLGRAWTRRRVMKVSPYNHEHYLFDCSKSTF